ncbi:MAG TPA: TldD/PmbA family protein [Verrucomicrobiae bacterium]|nr:TldD/PmbA family protein [Verrucomicrobiae bacterium]
MANRKKTSRASATGAGHVSAADLRRIAERILKFSRAEETEVAVQLSTDALTRFANNTIHQNVAEQGLDISVRAVADGRTARASTNKHDDESLRRVAETALSLALNQPKNPDLLRMAGPQKYAKVSRFFGATAECSPQDRAKGVTRVCKMAERRKQTAAGIFSSGAVHELLANSRGLYAEHRQTRSEFSVTILEEDSSGWAKANSPDVRTIDPDALAESASRKAAESRHPRELAPGRYTAILEPAAVLDLLGFLFYDFAGTAVRDKRSCFTGRIGKKILGENISLWDDVYHPLQTGAPFDGEGVPRQRVALVQSGAPKGLVYSRATAKKMKAKPTGHGFALPNDYGEAPMNLVFAGGADSVEKMVSTTERGVLVTRLWYIREVDPYEKVLTGMTRDGTFLVENGKLAGGIRNFRFNQSVLELLANVEMLSPAVRAAGEESFEMVVPAMKVRGFHFSEVTKF